MGIKTIKEAKEIAKSYNKIKTDYKRLEFLKENQGKLKVVLDNDCTMVEFDLDEIDEDFQDTIAEIELNSFDDYHGWTDAIVELFQFAGIKAEQC